LIDSGGKIVAAGLGLDDEKEAGTSGTGENLAAGTVEEWRWRGRSLADAVAAGRVWTGQAPERR
jgi:hypothetical protein